jgi:xanthine/uracil/vitamin C permease (AzgA family)
VAEVRQHLIASTCIAAMISTFIMSLVARMPMAVAPAMGERLVLMLFVTDRFPSIQPAHSLSQKKF